MSPVAIFTDLLIAGIAGTLGYFGARLGGELWARLILDSQEAADASGEAEAPRAADTSLSAKDARAGGWHWARARRAAAMSSGESMICTGNSTICRTAMTN